MARNTWLAWIAVVAVLGGCGPASRGGRSGQDADALRQQAREVLARYDRAVLDAGGSRTFVPVGSLTGQVGTWEPSNTTDSKRDWNAGRVFAATALPAAPYPTGTVVWGTGATESVSLISADEALRQMAAEAVRSCPACTPLEVTGARLSTVRIQTTRGPATAPAWEYTLKATSVRVTRVAVSSSSLVTVTPPSWDPYNAPGGIAVDSVSTTTAGTRLTVTFTGAPGPASQPCGADYSGETVESANAVVVIVIEHPHAVGETCAALGATRSATVDLTQPLNGRAILDIRQGLPVPLTITP